MTKKRISLFEQGSYRPDWVKDFYDQAGIWWGEDPQAPGVHAARAAQVQRFCGSGSKRILECCCGSGYTAAAMADLGHTVIGVELSTQRARYAQALVKVPRPGALTVLEGDVFSVELEGCFDLVCCFEAFGFGSDADQRRLLKRMANDWLAPGGVVLMDVYSPAMPAREAGSEVHLRALKGVPGSVDMIERTLFDPVYSRWTDEWVPEAAPENALAQSLRCYSPADFMLLLEGTGLELKYIEARGQEIDFRSGRIERASLLMKDDPFTDYSYRVLLTAA